MTQSPSDAMSPDVAKPYAEIPKNDRRNDATFIEVNTVNGDMKMAINIDRIISIRPSQAGGAILMLEGIKIEVKETYESLLSALNN